MRDVYYLSVNFWPSECDNGFHLSLSLFNFYLVLSQFWHFFPFNLSVFHRIGRDIIRHRGGEKVKKREGKRREGENVEWGGIGGRINHHNEERERRG